MISFVSGEIYNLQIEGNEIPLEPIQTFFAEGHEDDLICVRTAWGKKLYINKMDFMQNQIDDRCVEAAAVDLFERLRANPHINNGVVVEDEKGAPVAIAREQISYYTHEYGGNLDKIDRSVLELYDCVCLNGLNEYSFLMMREVLPDYRGRIVLEGNFWAEWKKWFPEVFSREDVYIAESPEEKKRLTDGFHTMNICFFLSNVAGTSERCRDGIFSYDEIMLLLYLFVNEKRLGKMNKGKKFYVMDARFAFQGLLSICHKLSVPCAYIKSKGYIPIIRIKSSYQSHYSDFVGEDIWSKFFVQPEKCSVQAYANSASVTFSSNFNMSFSGMWLMEQIAHCGRMNLVGKKFFNYELKKYVDERRAKISGGGYTCSGRTDTWNGLCGQQTAWA